MFSTVKDCLFLDKQYVYVRYVYVRVDCLFLDKQYVYVRVGLVYWFLRIFYLNIFKELWSRFMVAWNSIKNIHEHEIQ